MLWLLPIAATSLSFDSTLLHLIIMLDVSISTVLVSEFCVPLIKKLAIEIFLKLIS